MYLSLERYKIVTYIMKGFICNANAKTFCGVGIHLQYCSGIAHNKMTAEKSLIYSIKRKRLPCKHLLTSIWKLLAFISASEILCNWIRFSYYMSRADNNWQSFQHYMGTLLKNRESCWMHKLSLIADKLFKRYETLKMSSLHDMRLKMSSLCDLRQQGES